MYGYPVNLNIKSQHFPWDPNLVNLELRKCNIVTDCINNGYQYSYWKAKVFTKAMIGYGCPNGRRLLLQTYHIKTKAAAKNIEEDEAHIRYIECL